MLNQTKKLHIQLIFFLTIYMPDGNIRYSEKQTKRICLMAKVTTEEMIALLNADIKFAKMIGDKEFVGYLKETKDKLLKEMGEAVAKEYIELFGK